MIAPAPVPISHQQRKDSKWEILSTLEQGNTKPKTFEGFLAKRRKWPLKGWHKRYYFLEKGVLSWGKVKFPTHEPLKGLPKIFELQSQQDVKQLGRTHGKINLGNAVISGKSDGLRIDINADHLVHHLKVGLETDFHQWTEKLQQHKLFQNQVT